MSLSWRHLLMTCLTLLSPLNFNLILIAEEYIFFGYRVYLWFYMNKFNDSLTSYLARVIEEQMFGIDNMCWISSKATLDASRLAEFLILQTGMTAFGKAYYRNQSDLVPNVRLCNMLIL